MGQIRPLTAADITSVAGLFQYAFKRKETAAPAALVDCLRAVYIDHPLAHESLPPLVYEGRTGISGFVGRHRLPMRIGDRPVNGALIGTIMSDSRAGEAMIGPKLLKAALAGNQDFSFTDTASDISLALGQRLGCTGLPNHSLSFIRIIRPAQWLAGEASRRFRPLGLLRPFAAITDEMLRARMKPNRPRWLAYARKKPGKAAIIRDIDAGTFAELMTELSTRFTLRPRWSSTELAILAGQALHKQDFGPGFMASVSDHRGQPVGCFLYHLSKGSSARVLQMMAAPGSEGAVIDALIGHAADNGATAVTGRTKPYLMEAMLGRRIGFTNSVSSMINTRDPDILAAITRGDVMLNGLVGEQWSPMIGNRFD
ncbi:hypothetical protein J2T09_003096 [Neorhizobium huautlense]|uniref:GNAT family N-acetyltransferase n=1 Tax=Neorhizobium huautlense TaxID=67774 RepID=A0ABT9PX52_9HYPH|nr:hypothetical protein [Neorhizobium huautlense]MDP9838329.1 hypothetical protein [Neorhizobium huautlense]